jgi:hypothetical protein
MERRERGDGVDRQDDLGTTPRSALLAMCRTQTLATVPYTTTVMMP